jgi:transcriptional regulator with XRE-family HTH domain
LDLEGLGEHLKGIRLERRLTLDEMSRACGVSIGTLSKMENGQVSPGYKTLRKIADGLNVSFERLVNDRNGFANLARRVVTRKNEALSLDTKRYTLDAYAADLVPKAMIPFIMHVKARNRPTERDLNSHEGEEFILLLSGEVEVHLENYAPFQLKQGDGVYIDSRMKHAVTNIGRGTAKILSIYYDPRREMQKPADLVNSIESRHSKK